MSHSRPWSIASPMPAGPALLRCATEAGANMAFANGPCNRCLEIKISTEESATDLLVNLDASHGAPPGSVLSMETVFQIGGSQNPNRSILKLVYLFTVYGTENAKGAFSFLTIL